MTHRLYCANALSVGAEVLLDPIASRHLREALRATPGDSITLFDGNGGEFAGTVHAVTREGVVVAVARHLPVERESPLAITLAQGISRGERMDLTIQKAVELGVHTIVPLTTERSTVRLDDDRAQKREIHWRGIVRHAAEQSGRTRLPVLDPVTGVAAWAAALTSTCRLLLDPSADTSLGRIPLASDICLAVGPEGGFSPGERVLLASCGFRGARLGPRILRTETAALVALSILQDRAGDLG